ncbi:hypothetical protein [Alicyclobacillus fructus]|uniref:hypothetical protein n=1 Tax=Alicyclobacillus fructus TaxID=2816082 RepID=UPI001A8E6EC5|nr:hypothetical protein [Alicyclobacillus fructus]
MEHSIAAWVRAAASQSCHRYAHASVSGLHLGLWRSDNDHVLTHYRLRQRWRVTRDEIDLNHI